MGPPPPPQPTIYYAAGAMPGAAPFPGVSMSAGGMSMPPGANVSVYSVPAVGESLTLIVSARILMSPHFAATSSPMRGPAPPPTAMINYMMPAQHALGAPVQQVNPQSPDVRLYCAPPGNVAPVMLVTGGAGPGQPRSTTASYVSYQQAPVSMSMQQTSAAIPPVQQVAYAPASVQPSTNGATPGLLPRPGQSSVPMNVGFRPSYPFQPYM